MFIARLITESVIGGSGKEVMENDFFSFAVMVGPEQCSVFSPRASGVLGVENCGRGRSFKGNDREIAAPISRRNS